VGPSHTQKRWSARLRTAGALLLMAGAVGLGDGLLPGSREGRLPAGAEAALALGLLALGALSFLVGKRWR
jgi:hypothetical protein